MKVLPTPQDHIFLWVPAVEVAERFSISTPQLLSGQDPEQGSRDDLTHDCSTRKVHPNDLCRQQQLDSPERTPVAVSNPPWRCTIEPLFDINPELRYRSQLPSTFEGQGVHLHVLKAIPLCQALSYERFTRAGRPNDRDLVRHL